MKAAEHHLVNQTLHSVSEREKNISSGGQESPPKEKGQKDPTNQVSWPQLMVAPVEPGPQGPIGEQGVDASESIDGDTIGLAAEGTCCKHSDIESNPVSELLEKREMEGRETPTDIVPSECHREKHSVTGSAEKPRETIIALPSLGRFGPPSGLCAGKAAMSSSGNVQQSDDAGKSSSLLRKKYTLRSSINIEQNSSSNMQKTPEELASTSDVAVVSSEPLVKHSVRKRRKKAREREKDNEYTRVMKSLRYLLNRINYEQSLITAYSAEGWRGLSLEKLKPEKELERATKEILRRKLQIRNVFQHLDALLAQGCLPEELFDSEGEISSEDIFCAKCGSKDLSADNDIILCDGACDRGFHQFCLEPPLLKQDIPPNDEAWLCPGCVCKAECIELLNDSLGTRLFITDNYEKVFPEAAAAAGTGHAQDPNFGLPSDDSDDEDYEPKGPEIDEEEQSQQDESSHDSDDIDESDFTSESCDLEASSKDEQFLGLPSDESDDDDYDPDAADVDEKAKNEETGSDFTSDSEDFAAVLAENGSDPKEVSTPTVLPGDSGRASKLHGKKKPLINDELSSLKEDPSEDGWAAAPEKRAIERLDYKKLYDETYGNIPSSSSDDENWMDDGASTRRRQSTRGSASAPKGRAGRIPRSEAQVENPRQPAQTTDGKLSRASGKSKLENNGISSANTIGLPIERNGSSARKRLGEVEKQRLFLAFQENQYPERATKKKLASELGVPYKKVEHWFKNVRWSFNHSSSKTPSTVKTVSKKGIQPPQTKNKVEDKVARNPAVGPDCREGQKDPSAVVNVTPGAGETEQVSGNANKGECTASKSRKRRRR